MPDIVGMFMLYTDIQKDLADDCKMSSKSQECVCVNSGELNAAALAFICVLMGTLKVKYFKRKQQHGNLLVAPSPQRPSLHQ
jgi:hypothetical protein